jgi:transcription elongation factor Elf1
MSNLFNLIEIEIARVKHRARPIDFTYDENRQPISITKIVTTCPKCSSLNEYDVDIKDNVGTFIFKCKQCEPNVESKLELIEQSNKIEVINKAKPDTTKVEIVANKKHIITKMVDEGPKDNKIQIINPDLEPESDFIDPVKLGLFNVEPI